MTTNMDRFIIYCTEEQTRKAMELGAPIEYHKLSEMVGISEQVIENGSIYYNTPTAEQMIGWLEEQGILVDINPINGLHFYWMIRIKKIDKGCGKYIWETQYITPEVDLEYNSRKETYLAAIDAALEYLTIVKK